MAAGQTVAEYNGVSIRNAILREFRQEPQYDESGTDVLFTRYTIRVGGIVHGNSTVESAYNNSGGQGVTTTPGGSSGSAASHYNTIQHRLSESGYSFALAMGVDSAGGLGNGVKVVDVQGARLRNPGDSPTFDGTDVDNGPKPKVLSITRVMGNESFWIEFEIACAAVGCDSSRPNSTGVLSNRWGVSDQLDTNFYCTRTYRGTLRIAYIDLEPHDYRSLVLPPLALGMRRDSMTFESTPDGLTLRYTVVDRETAFAPPAPATKWSLTRRESLTANFSILRRSAEIAFEAPPSVSKRELAGLAINSLIAAVAPEKIDGVGGNESVIEQLDIVNEINDSTSRISGRIASLYAGGHIQNRLASMASRMGGDVTATFQKNANWPDDYDRFEHAQNRPGEALQATGPIVDVARNLQGYLQSPCDSIHGISEGPTPDNGGETETESTRQSEPEVPDESPSVRIIELPYDTVDVSDDHLDNVYTLWEMESEYQTRDHVLAMPRALPPDASPSEESATFVAVAPSTTRRVMTIAAERSGVPPQLPARIAFTDSNGIRHIPLGGRVLATPQERDAIGLVPIYRAEAEYVYGLGRTPSPTEQLAFGVTPWLDAGAEERDDLFGENVA